MSSIDIQFIEFVQDVEEALTRRFGTVDLDMESLSVAFDDGLRVEDIVNEAQAA